MKSRWQKSLEAAVSAYDTPMPWTRGEQRKAQKVHREAKPVNVRKIRRITPREAQVA